MKNFTVSRIVLAGGLLLLGAVFQGCGSSTESQNYQEYSDLNGVEDKAKISPDKADSFESQTSGTETVKPAVAEKTSSPAIAQASPERLKKRVAQGNQPPADSTETSGGQALAKVEEKAEPREIKLLVPEKNFKKADRDGTLRVSYDDIDLLKILNMEPVPTDATDYFPDWLEELEGERIRIRGFMYPAFQQTGLRAFVLARDNEICCFGRNPKVYDLINVAMRKGTTTDYLPNRPFDVEGTFHIRPETEDGTLLQLYEIRDAEVITGRSR